MTRYPFVSTLLIAAACAGAEALGREASPQRGTANAAATETRPAPRVISPERVAQLSAVTPKFDPIAPKEKSAEPLPDLREIDKPRNTIIRLPEYLVQEDRPPALKERELMTPQERLNLALKRRPGLRVGSIGPLRNDGVALFMLEEEERLERMKEMSDLLSLLPDSQQKQLKPTVDRTFIRNELPR